MRSCREEGHFEGQKSERLPEFTQLRPTIMGNRAFIQVWSDPQACIILDCVH